MNEQNNNDTEKPFEGDIPDELLLPEEETEDAEQARGRQILRILVAIAAGINIIVFILSPGELLEPGNLYGILLSVAILIGVILLGFFWQKPSTPTVNVKKIKSTEGTSCSPNGKVRIAREKRKDPSSWTVVKTYTKKSLSAKAEKHVPSTKYLTYGFAEITRTLYYTCQKQVCKKGTWTNVGNSYTCDISQTKEVQVYGGPGQAAPLQGWTDKSIRQSFDSGYYN